MSVRAKFYVSSLERFAWGDSMVVTLQAVTSKEGDNATWSAATPSGTLKMTITNRAAWPFYVEAFTEGRYIWLDQSHAELGAPANKS